MFHGMHDLPDLHYWCAQASHPHIQNLILQVNRLEITSNKQLLAAAGNPHIRIFEVNSNAPQPVASYDGHTGNVTAVGFQKDSKWMFSGSEDGTVKIWDLRAPGFQREYASRGGVNSVVLHPNQGELISGAEVCLPSVIAAETASGAAHICSAALISGGAQSGCCGTHPIR